MYLLLVYILYKSYPIIFNKIWINKIDHICWATNLHSSLVLIWWPYKWVAKQIYKDYSILNSFHVILTKNFLSKIWNQLHIAFLKYLWDCINKICHSCFLSVLKLMQLELVLTTRYWLLFKHSHILIHLS